MAKHGLFLNNGCVAIAETDEEKNNLSNFWLGATVKTLTDDQFNDAASLKSVLSLNEGTVISTIEDDKVWYNDSSVNVENAKTEIQNLINDRFLAKLSPYCYANPNDSYWADYKNKIEAVDVNSMSFPLSHETFQEWFNNQTGNPTKSILQCP